MSLATHFIQPLIRCFYQIHTIIIAFNLSHGFLNLGMTLMPNHNNFLAFFTHLRDFNMNFSNEWTGCIKNSQLTDFGLPPHLMGNTMRTKYQYTFLRDFIKIFNENCAFLFQILDDKAIMHHLMTHINRCAMHGKRSFNNLNSPIYTGAKSSWVC